MEWKCINTFYFRRVFSPHFHDAIALESVRSAFHTLTGDLGIVVIY